MILTSDKHLIYIQSNILHLTNNNKKDIHYYELIIFTSRIKFAYKNDKIIVYL